MYLGEHDMAKKHFSQALNYEPDFKVAKEAFNRLKALERAKKSAARSLEGGARRQAAGCRLAARARRRRQRLPGGCAAALHGSAGTSAPAAAPCLPLTLPSSRPCPAPGDAAAAVAEFSEALHVDPQHDLVNKELWMGLCKAQVRAGGAARRGAAGQSRRRGGLPAPPRCLCPGPRPLTLTRPPARLRYAQVQLRAFEDARHACQAVITLDAGNHEAHTIRARTLMAEEKWEEAMNAARDSIQHHQQSQELHGVRGERGAARLPLGLLLGLLLGLVERAAGT
jgi:tetratricopeptide (TPR) repeat protein